MSGEPKGLRALPPALVLGFAGWLAWIAVRIGFGLTHQDMFAAVRFGLVGEGVIFACELLALLGAFALARQLTGGAARGVRIAAFGLAGVALVDVAFGFFNFMAHPWQHEWLIDAFDYARYVVWLAVPIGLAIACGRQRRVLGIVVIAISLVTWLPPPLASRVYVALSASMVGLVLKMLLTALGYATLLAGFAAIARSTTVADRVRAASGLRTAAKALWLRVIAAIVVVLLTLVVIGGRGSGGSIATLRLATLAAGVINILAVVQLGWGSVRAAQGSVPALGRWPLVLGGAASLWAAGVSLGQLPWLYKLLYQRSSMVGDSQLADYAQVLTVAMPLVITAGVALLAIAIGRLAAHHGNEPLRAQAQAKGTGFVALTLAALAISAWMVPKAQHAGDASSFVILSLLAAGASLAATVMMARLCTLGAEELERDAGLPAATVVSRGD